MRNVGNHLRNFYNWLVLIESCHSDSKSTKKIDLVQSFSIVNLNISYNTPAGHLSSLLSFLLAQDHVEHRWLKLALMVLSPWKPENDKFLVQKILVSHLLPLKTILFQVIQKNLKLSEFFADNQCLNPALILDPLSPYLSKPQSWFSKVSQLQIFWWVRCGRHIFFSNE